MNYVAAAYLGASVSSFFLHAVAGNPDQGARAAEFEGLNSRRRFEYATAERTSPSGATISLSLSLSRPPPPPVK